MTAITQQVGIHYVSIAPLREALQSRRRYESINDMAHRWASWTGRGEKACRRNIDRILYRLDKVSIIHADELCAFVIKVHPINLWVDEW